MNKEQLLLTRYEVVATDTSGRFKVGDILEYDFYDTWHGVSFDKPVRIYLENYPHLFRSLHWAEKRTVEEMPEYVTTKYTFKFEGKGGLSNGMVFKVEQWVTETFPTIKEPQFLANLEGYAPDYLWRTPEQKTGRVNACHLLPSSLEEYTDYINSKK